MCPAGSGRSSASSSAVTLPVYQATKAALTMLTVQYARALHGILVNAADPGFTSTDFNNHGGTQTVTEGTDAIVRLATLPPDADRHLPGPARPRSLVDQDHRRGGAGRRGPGHASATANPGR